MDYGILQLTSRPLNLADIYSLNGTAISIKIYGTLRSFLEVYSFRGKRYAIPLLTSPFKEVTSWCTIHTAVQQASEYQEGILPHLAI